MRRAKVAGNIPEHRRWLAVADAAQLGVAAVRAAPLGFRNFEIDRFGQELGLGQRSLLAFAFGLGKTLVRISTTSTLALERRKLLAAMLALELRLIAVPSP